jgi:hypothetical protein
LTDPTATSDAAEMFAFKASSFFRRRPCRSAATGSTHFDGLECQACATGDIRRRQERPTTSPLKI